MKLSPLPNQAVEVLKSLNAPPRLVAHLTLVHDVAVQITRAVNEIWPDMQYDRQAVLLGSAIHDIGKIAHPEELSQPGNQHEQTGPHLLTRWGISAHHARFAHTHGQWQETTNIEDLLVALADKVWKGARDEALEDTLVKCIANESHTEKWQVFASLDSMIVDIAELLKSV